MPRPVLLPTLILLGIVASATSAEAQLAYTFDADAQGWRRGNFDLATLALTDVGAATWNSGGYIDAPDFSDYAFHLSPDLGGRNAASAYGTPFTLDYSTEGAGALAPFVILTDGVGALYNVRTWTGGGAFESLSYTLDTTGGWLYGTNAVNSAPATEAQIRGVLGNLTRIGITADVVDGNDYTRVDNVRLNAVPEPATLSALGFGALILLRRRPTK